MNQHTSPPWSPETVERVAGMLRDGYSATQIAAELGEASRNIVIGRVHRSKYLSGIGYKKRPGRDQSKVKCKKTVRVRVVKPVAVKEPKDIEQVVKVEPVVVHLPVPMMLKLEENDGCKWPFGDPRGDGFGFCGHPRADGCPYCDGHRRLSCQQVSGRVAA